MRKKHAFSNVGMDPDGHGILGFRAGGKKASKGKGKDFIQKAIKKPGALRAAAKKAGAIDKDGKIKVSWLKKTAKKGGTMGKRANLALTLRKLK
jgi:hypothetical protein